MGDVLAYSSAMRRLAVEAGKVASDLRLLSMGPRAGLSEIALPAVQPGSSIMPGKVNPSVPEMVNQVCFQVIGCDTTVAMACEAGQLELNVMMPVIAWNALHASTILREAIKVFRTRCVDGITANDGRARELLDRSTATATALSPYIGYAATAELAKESVDDRPLDSRSRARARSARRRASRPHSVARGDDARRSGRLGLIGRAGRARAGGRGQVDGRRRAGRAGGLESRAGVAGAASRAWPSARRGRSCVRVAVLAQAVPAPARPACPTGPADAIGGRRTVSSRRRSSA